MTSRLAETLGQAAPFADGWDYYPSSGVGLILIIIVLAVAGAL